MDIEHQTTLSTEDDAVLRCCDCGTPFLFNEREAAFFADRGLLQPRRCKLCRSLRRQQRESTRWAV